MFCTILNLTLEQSGLVDFKGNKKCSSKIFFRIMVSLWLDISKELWFRTKSGIEHFLSFQLHVLAGKKPVNGISIYF